MQWLQGCHLPHVVTECLINNHTPSRKLKTWHKEKKNQGIPSPLYTLRNKSIKCYKNKCHPLLWTHFNEASRDIKVCGLALVFPGGSCSKGLLPAQVASSISPWPGAAGNLRKKEILWSLSFHNLGLWGTRHKGSSYDNPRARTTSHPPGLAFLPSR